MVRKLPTRLPPPEWLVRNFRLQRTPLNRAAAARAAVALSVPLAIGLAAGRPEYGALASIGALNGVISDTADAYRMRFINLAVPQVAGAIGLIVGVLVYGSGWIAVPTVTGIALLSGLISTIGAVASVSGLLLLLNAVVGAGLPLPGQWWAAPALMASGGLLLLVLALLAWPLRAGIPERASVAAAYRSVADLLAVCGDPVRYASVRFESTQVLNQSYDLLLAHRSRPHGRGRELTLLLAQLNAITNLSEAASAVHHTGRPLPSAVPKAVRNLAHAVETGYAGPVGLPSLPSATTEAARAVDQALRHAAEVVAEPYADASGIGDGVEGGVAVGMRAARVARDILLSAGAWRYGLRLALCIGIAQVLVSLIPVPRSYWVALTITFVLKPDFGSVFSRALLRALGTVGGLVIAAVILAEVPRGWWYVPVTCVLAFLIPALATRGYAYQTTAITPVILLLSDVLNHEGSALLLPRLADSVMGCAIALTVGYLLWPESWRTRVGDLLVKAMADTAAYVETAFGLGTDSAGHSRMRRCLYRDLSVLRAEFQRALTEPPPTSPRATAWWPLVVAVERIVDATTAAQVRVRHGAQVPSASEVQQLALQLHELSKALGQTDGLTVRCTLRSGPSDVLQPVYQEVAAATSVIVPR
ncbi:FUSC family protein [Streptomyces sp. NPDC046984]|uniref:FUSC family protein n=1 Tax=Streptomyces sp. NPDC046984 TaxID=3155138 RepID=UPI0033CB7877